MAVAERVWNTVCLRVVSLVSRESLIAGIIGTLGALWLYDNFIGWLNFLNATLPPIGAIIIADYAMNRRNYDPAKPPQRTVVIGALAGIVAGGLAGWFIPVGIGAINAILVAWVCYFIGRMLTPKGDEQAPVEQQPAVPMAEEGV